MPAHPLAELFAGALDIMTEIDRRAEEGVDHGAAGDVQRLVDRYHPSGLDLVVAEVITETATAKTFRLRRADGADLPPFQAGQYVTLDATVGGTTTSRPFAISSSPASLEAYDLTVRRVPGGRVSNHLIDHLAVGDRVRTSGPLGSFHHNPLFHGEDLVFLAGGSGVAPAMSMIRDIVDHGLARRLHLVYGSRTADDVIFRETLDKLAADHPDRIRVDLVVQRPGADWQGPTGLLTGETITALTGPLVGRMVYVCGPQAMYPYALAELARLGHPRRRVRLEANGAPARPQTQAGWPAERDPEGEVQVTVQGGPSFSTPRGRPLLDALEEHGVRPEVGCRSGECSLCRVRVVSGEVFDAEEARLRLSDAWSGYTHSCVAYPVTDVEIAL
ncbi:FAD-binding oxidoreductase [Kitasatospora sp. A2-31]|uniref:FAD-binding oxidoreductase n=1 Tax=Kitasatospora sp. A2-31 TaxID=2916414 RepID=UPI001EEBE60D|nr:FAD-binding oxidoreductase [Kitasatospora sp. A2-31]MCG6495237.1 FAD-binding oxidoreductase [Kitasatospora sp. A2-31]